jgi:hypothetical protein
MKKDFMNTQTGGKGETIQATPDSAPTSEQFEANIAPVQNNQDTQEVAAEEPVAAPSEVEPTSTEGDPVKKAVEKTVVQPAEEADALVGEKLLSMPNDQEAQSVDWFSPSASNIDLSEVDEQADGIVPQNLSTITPDGLHIVNQPQNEEKKELSNATDLNEEVAEKPYGSQVTPDGLHLTNDFSGVGKLPVLPLGVDSKEFTDLRNKYQGYEVKSDIWGNVSVSKTTPATQSTQTKAKQKPVEKQKVDYTSKLKGQVLTYPSAKNYEYIIGDEGWFRKVKGSKDWNLLTNENSVKALNEYFKTNATTTKKYTYPGREGYEYAIINDSWNIKKKGEADWTKIAQPERVKELNRYHKQNASMPLTAQEQAFNRAAKIQQSVGNEVSPTVLNPASVFSDGQPVIGITTGANSLFVDNKNKSFVNNAYDKQYRESEIEGLKKQRDIELGYAKTEAQKKQVNDRFNSLIFQQEEKKVMMKTASEKANKEASESLAEPKVESHILMTKGENTNYITTLDGANVDIKNLNIQGLGQIKGYGEDDLGLGILMDKGRAEESYRMAKAFADKDLDSWGNSFGVFLTKEQLSELKPIQDRFKSIVDKGMITPFEAVYLKNEMQKMSERINIAKETNEEINKAVNEGKSISEYQLDKKKELVSELYSVEELGGKESFLGRTKDLFNITTEMHDFMIDYVKSGKVTQDKNGVYRINPSLSEDEKSYLNKKLNGYIAKYTDAKATEYNTLQDDISGLKTKKKNQELAINIAIKNLSKLQKGTPAYEQALESVNKAKKNVEYLSGRIDKLSNGNRAFFLTEPKALAKSVTQDIDASSAELIFNSIDKSLTPKQRFDIFYDKLYRENQKIAADNNIDTGYWDNVGERTRSLLDMESLGMSLTKEEKKYYANLKIIRSLMPLYLNNENGITESSSGFFDAFMASFSSTLIGDDLSSAVGDITQTRIVNTQLEKLYKLGYTKEDLADPINLKDLEQRQNVSWVSAEGLGEILGPTAAIISELVVSNELGAGILKIGKTAANVFTIAEEGLGAVRLGDKIQQSYKVYEAAMQSNKVGKYLWKAAEEGVKMESAGNIFGNAEDELNFTSGFVGGLASEALTGLLSNIPASKLLPIVNGIFGSRADDAIAVFKKMGALSSRGSGEVAEEFSQELVSIYNSELKDRGFWEEVENRFGTFDKVMQFTVSSFVMGAGMGFSNTSEAQDLLKSMTPENRAKVEAVITESRQSFEQATDARNRANEAINKQIKNEARIEGIPDTEAPTIEWDITKEKGVPDTESPTVEWDIAKEKTTTNDKENESGIPSKVGEGEESVQAEPVTKTSEEAPSASGVVQEEQVTPEEINSIKKEREKALIEVIKIDSKLRAEGMTPEQIVSNPEFLSARDKMDALDVRLGKINEAPTPTAKEQVAPDVEAQKADIKQKIQELENEKAPMKDVNFSGPTAYYRGFNSKGEILEENASKNPESALTAFKIVVDENNPNQASFEFNSDDKVLKLLSNNPFTALTSSISDSVNNYVQNGQDIRNSPDWKITNVKKGLLQKTDKGWVVKEKLVYAFGDAPSEGVKVDNSAEINKLKQELSALEQAKPSGESKSLNPFEDVKSVASLPARSNKKKQAIQEFDAKHGEGSFERVSKIYSNFNKIVTKLEKNNIIEKEC